MHIKISKPFARNGKVDDFDTRQMKKALNRLGYYHPYEKTGITGTPDAGIFAALKTFQKDHGLSATGAAKPGDETIRKLNEAASQTPDGQYIWRTAEDAHVRKAHAEFNRTIRNWADTPDPGEDYNCRCWAESVSCDKEFMTQNVISDIKNDKYQWSWADYLAYFYVGGGQSIELSDMGWLHPIIEESKTQVFIPVQEQVADLARQIEQGEIHYTTKNTYKFESVSYPIGKATVSSETIGTVSINEKCLIIDAEVAYTFFDDFTDPTDLRGFIVRKAFPEIFRKGTPQWLIDRFHRGDWFDLKGTPYQIHGKWKTKLSGMVKRAQTSK